MATVPEMPRQSRAWTWLALAAVLVAVLLPVALAEIPALYDYPNRIAGLHVLTQYAADPDLHRNYAVTWSLQPNLAGELLALPLGRFLSAYAIGRLLLGAAIALPLIGASLLHRTVQGRFGWWPLVGALFLYNHMLAVGALNYLIAMGLLLIGLAGWRWLLVERSVRGLAVAALTALLLYAFHLVAFASYALCLGLLALPLAWHAARADRRRALAVLLYAGLPLVPPGLLAVAIRTQFAGGHTAYGGLREKLVALVSPTLFYGTPLDFVTFALVALGLGWLLASRQLVIAREFRWLLVGLVAVACLMPNYLGGIVGVDWRLPPLIALLVVAAGRFEPRDRSVAVLAACVAVALLGCRVWSIGQDWRRFDAHYAEFRQAAEALPRGARVLTVENGENMPRPPGFIRYPFVHLSALTVIDRAAFVPSLFTYTGPVFASEANRAIDARSAEPLDPATLARGADPAGAARPDYWADWPRRFDYVVWLHYGQGAVDVPRDRLAPLAEGSYFTIFRIVRG